MKGVLPAERKEIWLSCWIAGTDNVGADCLDVQEFCPSQDKPHVTQRGLNPSVPVENNQ